MKHTVLCLLLIVLLLPFHGIVETSESTGFDLKSLAEDTVFLVNLEDPTQAILGLERNADKKRYPASTTKIMTCILALEESDPDEIVTVSKRACNLSDRNSKMGLEPGEHYKMIDLLYGLMLPSGNDAAIAIAEHLGGSVNGFADLMNRKAQEFERRFRERLGGLRCRELLDADVSTPEGKMLAAERIPGRCPGFAAAATEILEEMLED